MNLNKRMLSLFVFLFVFAGMHINCNTGKQGMASQPKQEKVYTNLIDLLRDQPELTISGSENNPTIRIRGNTSLVSDNEPLFVVNGNPVGSGYESVVYSVDVTNVESIRVLTRSQAGLYGARGANGVVLIKTK